MYNNNYENDPYYSDWGLGYYSEPWKSMRKEMRRMNRGDVDRDVYYHPSLTDRSYDKNLWDRNQGRPYDRSTWDGLYERSLERSLGEFPSSQFEQFPSTQYGRVPSSQFEQFPSTQYGRVPSSQLGQLWDRDIYNQSSLMDRNLWDRDIYNQPPSTQYGRVPSSQFEQFPSTQYGRVPSSQFEQFPSTQFGQVPSTFDQVPSQLGQLSSRFGQNWFSPKWDISENDNNLLIHTELPGLDRSQIKIDIDGQNRLHIYGDKESRFEDKNQRFYKVERTYGSFRRTLQLPEGVDPNNVNAVYENGILCISIPKPASMLQNRRPINILGVQQPSSMQQGLGKEQIPGQVYTGGLTQQQYQKSDLGVGSQGLQQGQQRTVQ